MENSSNSKGIVCDGCGLPASPQHIAERLSRLELATRFRPIHIHVLFIAAAPLARSQDDFYKPPDSREFFDPLMDAVEISASAEKSNAEVDQCESDTTRLLEFQRRGYYLSYLSECPIPASEDAVNAAIFRLGPTLVKRVRFNYKPKHVALLGVNLAPLRDIFDEAGMSVIMFPSLPSPTAGDADATARIREAMAKFIPHEKLASRYDKIEVKSA